MGMGERRRQVRLAPQPRRRFGNQRAVGSQDFDGDDALGMEVHAPIDARRATQPDTGQHPIAVGQWDTPSTGQFSMRSLAGHHDPSDVEPTLGYRSEEHTSELQSQSNL